MASSTLGHGFTTRSESALGVTCMKLLEISDNASHEDLLSLLSLVQMLDVDILPLVWYPALHVGRGGFAVLNEAPVNREVNLAFKRLISLGSTSEKAPGSFSSSMKEIAILRHYNVSKHPNIVDFYGICWEVNPIGGQILPVLVLEKAPHGDLFRFRNSSEGKKLSVKTKLSLCTQIAEGLAMLHASLIVHCDMKPQNILILEGDGGGLVAKIADFGSSMTGQEEEDMHGLPHSGIWSAPEYHHRKISIAAAKKMDAYSFSFLCLWLLLDESHGAIDGDSSTTVLRQMKESCDFIARAHDLVTSLDLESEASHRLGCLFETTLADDPLKRVIDMQAMPKLLNPDQDDHSMVYGGSPVLQITNHVNFNISHNLYPLTFANYLVRSLIFQCLEHKAKTSKCKKCTKRAAFELAFCYYIGFGTESNRQLAESWACKAGKELEDLEDEKDEVTDYDLYPNLAVNELRNQHFSMIMDHTNEYRRPDYDINVVLGTLQREIRDLDEAFESQFMLTTTLRGVLAGVYLGAGHTDDAERIYRQLVDFFEQDPDHGSTHPDTWSSQQHLSEILRQGGKLGAAEELARRCLTNRKKLKDVKNSGIIECKATLGSILFNGERFEEAIELFIETHQDSASLLGPEHPQTLFAMSNLACAYRAQGLLAEAEDLDLTALEIKKRILDNEEGAHFSTVTSAANLAFTYSCQKRWDEAENLEIWVLQERTKSLGEIHPATLLARKQLAETYCQQGKAEDAQAVLESKA